MEIVTGTPQSANNMKRKNKQINNDKKIPATNQNLRLSMQTTEKRSDDVKKLNLDWLAIFRIKKDEKCSTAKRQHVAANW